MREQLESAAPLIGAIGEHVLGSGGKRVRPALTLLSAELCGYTGPRRIQVGAGFDALVALELPVNDIVEAIVFNDDFVFERSIAVGVNRDLGGDVRGPRRLQHANQGVDPRSVPIAPFLNCPAFNWKQLPN